MLGHIESRRLYDMDTDSICNGFIIFTVGLGLLAAMFLTMLIFYIKDKRRRKGITLRPQSYESGNGSSDSYY